MRKWLKKILQQSVVAGIRRFKANLTVIARNWEKFKKENPEAHARAHADRVDYS